MMNFESTVLKRRKTYWATRFVLAGMLVIFLSTGPSLAVQLEQEYLIVPEDVLGISVWRDKDLTLQTIVRPDGKISFPLIGDVAVAGHSVDWAKKQIQGRIREYIPDAVVSVMVMEMKGMFVSVVGKVLRPGGNFTNRRINVMQALALTGGLARFAKEKDIIILRTVDGQQTRIPFNYKEVKNGKNIEQNIMLTDGDVIVVP